MGHDPEQVKQSARISSCYYSNQKPFLENSAHKVGPGDKDGCRFLLTQITQGQELLKNSFCIWQNKQKQGIHLLGFFFNYRKYSRSLV